MENVSKRSVWTSGSKNKKRDIILVSVIVILDMMLEASSNMGPKSDGLEAAA